LWALRTMRRRVLVASGRAEVAGECECM
jgi:hypothetical protein